MIPPSISNLFIFWYLSDASQSNAGCLNMGLLALCDCCDILALATGFSASLAAIIAALAASIAACFVWVPFSFFLFFDTGMLILRLPLLSLPFVRHHSHYNQVLLSVKLFLVSSKSAFCQTSFTSDRMSHYSPWRRIILLEASNYVTYYMYVLW